MAKTWILVAHEAGARLFESPGPGKGLELIEEIDHPEGRERDGDLVSDRPGRSFRKNSGDTRRASMGSSEGPHDRAVANFARYLAQKLQQGRVQNLCQRFVSFSIATCASYFLTLCVYAIQCKFHSEQNSL